METEVSQFQHTLLINSLTNVFGEFDTALLAMIEPMLDWMEIGGGETLFSQHDAGDSLFFVISGRLQVFVNEADGNVKKIGEVMRGETVGEMAVFTGKPRSATIVAIRDSLLVKLSKTVFEQVITAYPAVAMNVTNLIISRLQKTHNPRVAIKKPVNICLLALHDAPDMAAFVAELTELLGRKGTVYVASSAIANQVFGQLTIAEANKTNSADYRKLTRWLEDQELKHEFLIFVADPTMTEWTRRCMRQADQILLLADARQPATPPAFETQYQAAKNTTGATEVLVLLHPATTRVPRHTADWLVARPAVKSHYHLRTGSTDDMARLARILSGTANGLVLAGGGAKGFAHLGVFRALQEVGIPIDFVGGTSIGGMMAAGIGFGSSADEIIRIVRKGALYNPTKDYNVLPFMSLIGGRRMAQMLKTSATDIAGSTDIDIEDSWRTLFMVSSNYSKAREEVHLRGNYVRYLLATSAIPGVFPPVIDGDDLLVDGGTFNNFPADVMSRMDVGRVIGVDLIIDKPRKMTLAVMPTPNELLRDRFRAKKQRRYRLPSLMSIMLNATLLYSAARRNETKQFLDLAFNPDVTRFGLLSWSAFDKIVETGYNHARTVLAGLSDDELDQLRA